MDIYAEYPEFIVGLNKRTIVRDLNTAGEKIKQMENTFKIIKKVNAHLSECPNVHFKGRKKCQY